jgi:hypothetical protein
MTRVLLSGGLTIGTRRRVSIPFLLASRFLVVGLGVAELGEAIGTDMRPVTGLAWVVYLIRALP